MEGPFECLDGKSTYLVPGSLLPSYNFLQPLSPDLQDQQALGRNTRIVKDFRG